MRAKLLFTVFMAMASLGFAQTGSMATVAGINTVQYGGIGQTATPDPTIAVGTLEFCEHVNSAYQCWYKNGPSALQPVSFFGTISPKLDATIWTIGGNNSGNTPNCGTASSPNAQILHDNVYGRWILQKRITSALYPHHNYMCLAISNVEDVSQTSPVAFNWFAYEFDLDTVIPQNAQGNYYYPDYPQAGLWQTSTSTTAPYTPASDQAMWITYDLQDTNSNNNTVAVLVCAVDLAGLRASTFNPWVNNSHTPACAIAHGIVPYTQRDNWVPANNNDSTPPLSSDGEMFTYITEPPRDGHTYLTDPNHTQGVEQWTIDWTAATPTPTFVNSWDLPSTQAGGDQMGCFNPGSYYNTVCIPQPSTATTGIYIDSVGDRMQEPFQYTSNGGNGGIWTAARSMQINASKSTRSQTEADLRILQWNSSDTAITLSADYPLTDPNDPNAYVSLPSVARDQAGNLQGILSVSGSGANEHPGLDSLYVIPSTSTIGSYGYIANPGTDGDAEDTDPAGYRWGDWSGAVLDPSDSCTVWVVGEFLMNNRTTQNYWYTEIAQLPPLNNCGAQVSLAPNSLNFGTIQVSTTSSAQVLTLTNNQAATLNISNITTTGDFSQTNNCGSSLNAGSNCTINVTFSPSASGARKGTLLVYDGVTGSPQAASLSGTGAVSAVMFSPATLLFPTTAIGTTSAPQTSTLTNVGGVPITVQSVVASGGYAQSGNCAGALQPQQSCSIVVTFTPPSSGTIPGEITVGDTASDSPQIVSLSGAGIVPLSINPASIPFGPTQVNCGASCVPHSVTLTNNSSSTLNLAVSASTDFSAVAGGKIPCGSTLASGSQCTLNVSFTPAFNGQIRGGIQIAFGGAFSPVILNVTGTGVGGSNSPITFNPTNLTFTNVPTGTTSAVKIFRVMNPGASSVNLGTILASGDYAVTQAGARPCGTTLAAGATCTVGVTFGPVAVGTTFGSIAFSGTESILNISGTSVLPLTLAPSSISFGNQAVGTTSGSQTVTLTNNLASPLAINSIVASGDFVVTTTTCGSSLPALGSCTAAVAFSPAATGAINGTLTVSSNASSSPQIVSLAGSGQ